MKKLTKAIGVMLVVAMLAAMMSVMSFAKEPASIKVLKEPDRKVCYEEYDTFNGDAYCEPTGMVLEVTMDDGAKEEVECDFDNVTIIAEDYKLGENEAVVEYGDLTTTLTITVEENPVASVVITKMPTKTEYDWDKDVLTRDNFTIDRLYALAPEIFDEVFAEADMTLEEIKAVYAAEPKLLEELKNDILPAGQGLLLPDFSGMEIKITYTDGTSEVLGYEDDYNTYGEFMYPVYVLAEENGYVKVGENKYFVEVMGTQTPFTLTVKKTAPATPDEKPPVEKPKDDPKNPVIPNTDGTSVAAVAVIALMSACGVALIPSKKER